MNNYTLEQVVNFLLGEAPLGTAWYGESPQGRPALWWREHLREAMKTALPTRPIMAEIARLTAEYYGLTPNVMQSKSRRPAWAMVRMVAMALCRKYSIASTTEIAEFFNRDHTAVIHATKQVKNGELAIPEPLEAAVQILQKQTNDTRLSVPPVRKASHTDNMEGSTRP